MARSVGQQERCGRAAQVVPGLADGPLRKLGAPQDARHYRQRPNSDAVQAIQPILHRPATVFGAATCDI